MTEIAQTGVAMHDLYLLANENLPQSWEGAEDCGEGCRAIDHPVWKMVHFEAIGKVSDAIPAGVAVVLRGTVRVSDDDDSVTSVDKFS